MKSSGRKKVKAATPRRSSRAGGSQAVVHAIGGRESLEALQQAVEKIAPTLHDERLLRPGIIVFRTLGAEGAAFALRVGEGGAQIESSGDYSEPLLEVMGDPRRLQSILSGAKDARKQFFAGGIRVRGDVGYLSKLGMRLGFLKTPII